MKLRIGGMGWVTPLGHEIDVVWRKLLLGEEAKVDLVNDSLGIESYPAFTIPAGVTAATLPKHPRLRRSSSLSRFAAIAGLAALRDAQLNLTQEAANRTALIFAISNGGVIYTKRFYHEVIATGAKAASPLLFPETVFNAPASHLASILGITGASYTLVGDGAVGLLAIKMAEDLLQGDAFDRCLLVATEEADWLLCDAYRKWRLMRKAPPIEPFHETASGMILSEGAGALLLGDEGSCELEQISAGYNFNKQAEACSYLDRTFRELSADEADLVVTSANGTFVDRAEEEAILRHCPEAFVYTPKPALGESIAVGGLWQVICAAKCLTTRELPPVLHSPKTTKLNLTSSSVSANRIERVLVSGCGLNQQVAALRMRNST